MIAIRKFASVAEAAATYYGQGYASIPINPNSKATLRRIMKRGLERVYIFKIGLLEVEAHYVNLERKQA